MTNGNRIRKMTNGNRIRKGKSGRVANSFLEEIVRGQRQQNRALPSREFLHANEFFGCFLETKNFWSLYDEAMTVFQNVSTPKEASKARKRFVGGLFQSMAHYSLTAGNPKSRVLLSNEHTFKFLKYLYPREEVIDRSFGLSSFAGVATPDGLMAERVEGIYKVGALCEYSLIGPNSIRRKYGQLNELAARHPEYFGESLIQFGLIRSTQFPEDLEYGPGAYQSEIPFNHNEFGQFVYFVLNHPLKRSNIRSLMDILDSGSSGWKKEIATTAPYINPRSIPYRITSRGNVGQGK
jgi:hypothetical protein